MKKIIIDLTALVYATKLSNEFIPAENNALRINTMTDNKTDNPFKRI